MALKNFFCAGKIAAEAARNASKLSREKLRKAFVDMSLKLAQATGWSAVKNVAKGIVDIIFTVTGKSLGDIIAEAIDRLDGKNDNYIFA